MWRVFSLHFNSTSSIPKIKGFYHISSLSRDCRLIFFAFDAFFLTGLFPSFASKWTLIGLGNVTSYCTYRQVYYHPAKTLTVLNKVVCFNPWRFPSSMLDNACLSKRIVFIDFTTFFFIFSLLDFSYAQLGRRGVWDSSHYASTWDGVWSEPVRSGFTVPNNARAPYSTERSINPPVSPSKSGSALHYYLTQHDGPGRAVCQ